MFICKDGSIRPCLAPHRKWNPGLGAPSGWHLARVLPEPFLVSYRKSWPFDPRHPAWELGIRLKIQQLATMAWISDDRNDRVINMLQVDTLNWSRNGAEANSKSDS